MLIGFFRTEIFNLKREIESRTKFKVAIVYGSLPAEVRVQQAQLFNDPKSKYDILVATDAIGYGLNLSIRRIIFWRISKFDGYEERLLDFPQIRQIGGRAGRYQSRYPTGEVTTFKNDDLDYVRLAFRTEPEHIACAGLIPTPEMLEAFAHEFPNEKLSSLINRFMSLTKCDQKYFICNLEGMRFSLLIC